MNVTTRHCSPQKHQLNENTNSLFDKCSSVSKTELHKGVHMASNHELLLPDHELHKANIVFNINIISLSSTEIAIWCSLFTYGKSY